MFGPVNWRSSNLTGPLQGLWTVDTTRGRDPAIPGLPLDAAPLRGTPVVAGAVLRATLTVRVPLAGRLVAGARARGALAFAVPPTPLAGVSRSAERLRSTGLVLAYRSTPARTTARCTGALTTRVALAGRSLEVSRLRGQWSTRVPMVGRAIEVSLLVGSAATRLALTGRVIASARGLGALTAAGITTALAGVLRGTARARSTGLVLAYRAQVSRATARATATLRTTVALTGSSRIAPARLTGGLATGVTASVAGRVVAVERLRGATLVSTVALTGRTRTAPRLPSAPLTLGIYAADARGPIARLHGTLGTRQAIAGRVEAIARLRATLSMAGSGAALAGVVVGGATRLRALGIVVTYRATPARTVARLPGAVLSQRVALRGVAAGTSRLVGSLGSPIVALAGRATTAARLVGALTSRQALTGRSVATPRALGAVRFVQPLVGATVSAGRLRTLALTLAYRAQAIVGTTARGFATLTAGNKLPLAGVVRLGSIRAVALETTLVVWTSEARGPTPQLRATLAQRLALAGVVREAPRTRGALRERATPTIRWTIIDLTESRTLADLAVSRTVAVLDPSGVCVAVTDSRTVADVAPAESLVGVTLETTE